VSARLLLAPLLAGMAGRSTDAALHWEPARLGTPLPANDSRETFHRARLSAGEATPLNFQQSHAQKVLAEADVLIRQAANGRAIAIGAQAHVLRL
jgi:molybdopterin molybdotransferase